MALAGQIAWDSNSNIVGDDFATQFAQALKNVLAVVREAGGTPSDVISLRIYVTDKKLYLAQLKEVGSAYRALFGRHYPAMALLEVKGLLEDAALVEIEALASIGAKSV